MDLNNIAIMHLFIKSLKRNPMGPGCCPSITAQILSKLIEYEPSYVSELLESRFCEPYGEIPRTYWEFEEPSTPLRLHNDYTPDQTKSHQGAA